jgi:hypothetical protein
MQLGEPVYTTPLTPPAEGRKAALPCKRGIIVLLLHEFQPRHSPPISNTRSVFNISASLLFNCDHNSMLRAAWQRTMRGSVLVRGYPELPEGLAVQVRAADGVREHPVALGCILERV